MRQNHEVRDRVATFAMVGAAAMAVGACGGGGTAPVGPEEPDTLPPVHSIGFSPAQQYLGGLGLTRRIVASALNADGDLLYTTRERFEWSSSDPAVVTVDPQGVITSVGWGTATVSATTQGMTRTTPVTVRDAFEVVRSVPIPTGIDDGMVMGPDGTVYVGSNGRYVASSGGGWSSSVWYAVSPEGSIRWQLALPLTHLQIPAIGDDGTLYIGAHTLSAPIDSGGSLIAVNPDGTRRWTLDNLDRIRSSPALGSDGTIYVAGGHRVYAVNPTGEVRWAYEAADRVFFLSSPAIGVDGTIYLGGEDGRLYAIDPDGSLKWTFAARDRIRSSPSIGADGIIYFGSHDGRLYAVHPDGTERWSVALRCGLPWGCLRVGGSASISPDGTIYITVGGVYAVDPDGSIRWYYHGASQPGFTPVLGADGTLSFASSYPAADGGGRGMVVALDPQGRLLWEHRPNGSSTGSPIIGPDGTLIVAAGDELLAIVEHESTNGGYVASPWPTARGNRANNARAGG